MADVHAEGPGAIGVLGLWHLGCVTAACLAGSGRTVIGIDPDPDVAAALSEGVPPISEPGLTDLISDEIAAGRLAFTADATALADASVAWLTFDTPVDDDDRADVEFVLEQASRMLVHLPSGALVVMSSQLPVGSAGALAERTAAARGDATLRYACVPENLRLGQALESFRSPDRVVAGVRTDEDRRELGEILAPFAEHIEWMGVESAEMTKHALNGFLATSVAFINEIASICEAVGADAAEVARGLKSERRIGPRAYLSPGDAFAGGTLARDISFLRDLAEEHQLPAYVFTGVAQGNNAHKQWTQRKLVSVLGDGTEGTDAAPLSGRRIAVWGLTYKPGTDTLRRSSALELCRWLLSQGATVTAHDPAVSALPEEFAAVMLAADPLEALRDADVLVVCTPWPLYREVPERAVLAALVSPLVIDAGGFLAGSLGANGAIGYHRVGTSSSAAPQTVQSGR